jgi:hypothetical protein
VRTLPVQAAHPGDHVIKSVRSPAHLVVTIAVLAGVSTSSLKCHAANAFPTSREELDSFLKSEFPQPVANADQSLAIHGAGIVLGFVTTIYSAQFQKIQDAQIKRMAEAIKVKTNDLPAIQSRISVLSGDVELLEARAKAYEDFLTNPKATAQAARKQLMAQADAAANKSMKIQLTLLDLEKDARSVADIKSEVLRVQTQAELFRTQSALTSEMHGVEKRLGSLLDQISHIEKTGSLLGFNGANNVEAVQSLTKSLEGSKTQLAGLKDLEQNILNDAAKFEKTYGDKVSHVKRVRRLEKLAGLRVLGVIGGTALVANSTLAGYTAHFVGQDTGLVPLAHFGMKTYPEQMRDATVEAIGELTK